jgi:signal transduction histidine kinase
MHPKNFHAEVAQRFGILPNFFRSAEAAPELIEELWAFAKAGYLDNPMPPLFKERLFVWLSRFCPARYCIVRHVGFLLGKGHGHAAGDPEVAAQSVSEVLELLRRPTPWHRDMSAVYSQLQNSAPTDEWPTSGDRIEDLIFACAAVLFVQPTRSEEARHALLCALGPRRFEFFCGCLTFIRAAHYWTMLHPEVESEEDMLSLLRQHEELSQLLLQDPEADRCEMSDRLYEELRALRELRERQELQKAKQSLEEKDRHKDEYIATLAHELRNPLATIRSSTEALKLLAIPDLRASPVLQRLDRQSLAMVRMLDDLLDASRLGLGKVSVTLRPVDLSELVKQVAEERESQARESGLSLRLLINANPCPVTADQVRLRQIIDNLLSNAIKFTPPGGTILLALETESGGTACVKVKDSGVGFDEQFASKLFEPFVQQERSTHLSVGGLGLGLAIASRLAKLQGGSLTAESDGPSRGATFTLRIPRAFGN